MCGKRGPRQAVWRKSILRILVGEEMVRGREKVWRMTEENEKVLEMVGGDGHTPL